MGACEFMIGAEGNSPEEAFRNARSEALYMEGHGGYTGTIAEKDSFVMIDPPRDEETIAEKMRFASELMDNCDDRIDDKWGPAGCIKIENGKYLFFGLASS